MSLTRGWIYVYCAANWEEMGEGLRISSHRDTSVFAELRRDKECTETRFMCCAHREIAMSTTSSAPPGGRGLGTWDWDKLSHDSGFRVQGSGLSRGRNSRIRSGLSQSTQRRTERKFTARDAMDAKQPRTWLQKSVEHALPQLLAAIPLSLLCLAAGSKTRSERNTVESNP